MTKKKHALPGGIVYSTDPAFSFSTPVEVPVSLPPAQQQLKVRLDSRYRAGKVVTLVEGFVGPAQDLEKLGKELKTKCGTGGSAKQGYILLQGDYQQQVIKWLNSWGYGVRG